MPARQVIVDGSNLATEGRSLPSLAQLDQAVREFLAENPDAQVTVVVDASFGHRIDPSELPMFEEAEAAGEVASPPAGAIGRGDAFLLRIAEKTGATVLSNDSFQEFHGEHPWLFDDGRLIGGKPVPGVGWIFMPRAPVRGQKSREVVKEAKRKKRVEGAADVAGAAGSGLDLAASRGRGRGKKVDRAIARATEEAVEPRSNGRRRRRGSTPPADPVNEPLAFITFIAAHPLGSEVVGTVTEFSSHGAFVEADGARCYLPLSAMSDPPPRRAREVVTKGEERTFVVQALDPPRRGVELALPGFAHVAGGPTEETVEAEIHEKATTPKRLRREKTPAAPVADSAAVPRLAGVTDGKSAPDRLEAPAKSAGAAKKANAKKTPAPQKTSEATSARAKKSTEARAAGGKKTAGAKQAHQPDDAPAPVAAAAPDVAARPAVRSTAAAAKAGAVAKKAAARATKAGAAEGKKATPSAKRSPVGASAAREDPSSSGPVVKSPRSAAPETVIDATAPAQKTAQKTARKTAQKRSVNAPKKAAGSQAPGKAAQPDRPPVEPASTLATPGPTGPTRRRATRSTAATTTERRAAPATEAGAKKAVERAGGAVKKAGSDKRAPDRAKRNTAPRINPS